ncbi:MAG: MurT ligase domain-containing protein [Bacillota bacterium]
MKRSRHLKRNNIRPREISGLWLGKLLAIGTRLGGQGGTTLPGRAASALSPLLLASLAGQLRRGSLVITGTNGKTTTAYLLANIFRQSGFSVVHNRTGANLAWGITSALLSASTFCGHLPYDLGVMESDEGAFPGVVQAIQPRGAVITNIFRDQLDRYGEVDQIRSMIGQGLEALPEGAPVALNADDPSVVYLEQQHHRFLPIYYGFSINLPQARYQNTGQDIKSCPLCGRKLTYTTIHYAHLGRYRCPSCKFRRPDPEVRLINFNPEPHGITGITIAFPTENVTVHYPLPGIYNLYNALAAAACAWAWGLSTRDITAGLEQAVPSFGRMESFQINNRAVLMGLIKNPVGANEVLRTFLESRERINLLIAINDNYADGTDISWLWDVDFEQLAGARNQLGTLAVSGIRAADMGVRLKYAGLEPALITVEPVLKRALEQTLQSSRDEDTIFILPTYTAMLALRRVINRLGAARPFWEV